MFTYAYQFVGFLIVVIKTPTLRPRSHVFHTQENHFTDSQCVEILIRHKKSLIKTRVSYIPPQLRGDMS